jgi:hypothetical protein
MIKMCLFQNNFCYFHITLVSIKRFSEKHGSVMCQATGKMFVIK